MFENEHDLEKIVQEVKRAVQFNDEGRLRSILTPLYRSAITDSLTGLLNRNGFERILGDRIHPFLSQGVRKGLRQKDSNGPFASLAWIDLDRFKSVNDIAGHCAGDKVLSSFAAKLEHAFRPEDIVCRVGGDEFIVVLLGIGEKALS